MAYEAIELGLPGTPACPDDYEPESTLICPRATRLLLQVAKETVFVQLGVMQQGVGAGAGAVQWQEEKPFLPVFASLGRRFDAVRVRNRVPGAEAQVLLSVE
jgi:hypothetical protein